MFNLICIFVLIKLFINALVINDYTYMHLHISTSNINIELHLVIFSLILPKSNKMIFYFSCSLTHDKHNTI